MAEIKEEFEIRFENLTTKAAGTKAAGLRQELRALSRDVDVSMKKDDTSNQDFGATIVLVLGTPAILAIAKGIASYLQRNRGTISISKNGTLHATGLSGDDAARIAEAFSKKAG